MEVVQRLALRLRVVPMAVHVFQNAIIMSGMEVISRKQMSLGSGWLNIIDNIIRLMRNEPGLGLAAPQIGIPLRIIVLEDKREYMGYEAKERSKHKIEDLLIFCSLEAGDSESQAKKEQQDCTVF
ncbi:Peptide deformylase 1A [Spatholobus suberectus]|nr:Peptide deformylase 1A [Spatholobus suberectus]